MTREIHEYSSDEVSGLGYCGIIYSLTLFGWSSVTRDAKGNIIVAYYDFSQDYTKQSGCHQAFKGPSGNSKSSNTYFTVTKNDDGTTTESFTGAISIHLEDYCGVCFNPGNTYINSLFENKNSAGGQGAEAASLIAFLRMWAGTIPEGFSLGNPSDLRQLLRVWFRLFDIDSGRGLEVEDACTMPKRSLCDQTP